VERELVDRLLHYGPPLLFLAQVFGIFGLPVPDELLMTIAGALVASGRLNLSTTATAAVAGCLIGITSSYVLGRWVGLHVIRTRFQSHQHAITRAENWFRRFGGWLLMFGYFIPGVRHVTAIAAGSGSFSYRTFAAYAYPGGVLWCAVFLSTGYFAGDRWPEVVRTTDLHSGRLVWIAVVAAAVYGAVRLVRARGA
jgi:membrane protein DedA with SNARE-associated domain